MAQLLRQMSPNWGEGSQVVGMGRQRSLGSSQGPSGSIHRVSSLDGRDLTVEVIDRAPGLDADATRQALRNVRSAQDTRRANLERARSGSLAQATGSQFAAGPPVPSASRLEAADSSAMAGNRSVDLARRLEGRSAVEGSARGMAAQQV